ncbi:MAG: ribonuclease E inhibitor RraB [Candidatus Obscuribacter sp.]|jgi:regulator of RNase E activity RraB|nr:ribonuclease E inhibitor RraB [Candidatus Obscuribacter sp.]MDQ5967067.1 Ribonuclease inhibitor RraB [Cyanobacteriota bacterium erpe_2018_sw_39hr_WHONDRS-SW48-000098_B_bin.30]MBK7836636.1 ribonuclease E inhibitor RraB [Candidatus Obscuribacter sp.]MBK9204190.1 ribonuclease E inhibitor RraB [Candidatus Obscuribacter sp.]MBK9622597.1 ribonuclease E inhibitor RraB [Candidatus Obscuribacter sp.]
MTSAKDQQDNDPKSKESKISERKDRMEAKKEIEHTFFCETKESAHSLGAELTLLGHQVGEIEECDEEDQEGFYLETTELTTMSEAAANAANLNSLAEEFECVYDGWGVSMD